MYSTDRKQANAIRKSENLNTLTPYFALGFLPSKGTEILSRLQVSIFTQTLIKQSEVSI